MYGAADDPMIVDAEWFSIMIHTTWVIVPGTYPCAPTLTTVAPETPPTVARTVAVPAEIAAASPAPETVTAGADEVQAAFLVTSLVVPSPYVAVAVSCRVAPVWSVGLLGVTAT